MKTNVKEFPVPSIIIISSDDELQRKSQSEYNEQPTIIFFGNKRESLGNSSYRPMISTQTKQNAKLITCESNLIQSSPEKSEQSSRVDGEFVCKYLTPIKKQQFNQMLFCDQINERSNEKRTVNAKSLENKRNSKYEYQETKIAHKNNNPYNCQTSCCQHQDMVKLFKPFQTFNQLKQEKTYKKEQKYQFLCECKGKHKNNDKTSGIFINSSSQINFLKSNNHDLFSKLQKEIEKNENLQAQINQLLNENKSLRQLNIENENSIAEMKKLLKKYELQRTKYLVKEWEEFHFVKEILNQKKKSKSKQSCRENSSYKIEENCLRQNQNLRQTKKKSYDRTNESTPKVQSLAQKFSLTKQATKTKNFSSGNPSPSIKAHTTQSQKNNEFQVQKKRKISFENCSQSKRKQKREKQNEKIQRFLKDKLSVNIPQVNGLKKNQNCIHDRKVFKKDRQRSKENSQIKPNRN